MANLKCEAGMLNREIKRSGIAFPASFLKMTMSCL